MKKENILNLIKYKVENNDAAFKNEAITIARDFEENNDHQLAEYIMGLIEESNVYIPQEIKFSSNYLSLIDVNNLNSLKLPQQIYNDIKGIINAISHHMNVNHFLFEGKPGTGKTEAAKYIAKLTDRYLYYVNSDKLVDSKLGQTSKNINDVFNEILRINYPEKIIILFDEIDSLALDRINNNDVREMGRATSTILKEFDRLKDSNKDIVVFATTNLYKNFDKAFTRRFDAIVNFDRYTNKDLIEIGEYYYSIYTKDLPYISKDLRLFDKILENSLALPYPGELKNIIRTSLAFSDPDSNSDYLRRLYSSLIKDINEVSLEELKKQNFTIRQIAVLKNDSKSSIERKINGGKFDE